MNKVKPTGTDYSNSIANYISKNFGERGVKVYTEVALGKTIIGKNRRIDVFLVHESSNEAFAIECKFQDVKGTVDEKLVYAILDIEKLPIGGCLVYAGKGFSPGVLHLLESSPLCASCMPDIENNRNNRTVELDHLLAMKFGWWDLIVESKKAYQNKIGLFK